MWFKFSCSLLSGAACRNGKLPAELRLGTVTPCSPGTFFFPALLTAASWTRLQCRAAPMGLCSRSLMGSPSSYRHLWVAEGGGQACSRTEPSREAERQRESLIGFVAVRKKTLKVNIFLSLSLSLAPFVKTAWKYPFRGWTLPSKFNFEACQALLKPYHQWFPSLLDQEDWICYGIRIVARNSSQQMGGGEMFVPRRTLPARSAEVLRCALSAQTHGDFGGCSANILSWKHVCISELAFAWINTLLWMTKVSLTAAGVLKEVLYPVPSTMNIW